LEGQSRDEAAAALGWTPGAVKGCLERGRQMLANRLARRGITLSAGLLAAVTGNSAEGAVAPGLVQLTLRAARGEVRAAVAALVQGVSPMALLNKKTIATVMILVGLSAAAAGLRRPALVAQDKPAGGKAEAPK